MALENLSDQELHRNLQGLVQGERQVLTKILHHLGEVERRKLFCDFGCSSLFEYAINKLGYSEGQAHRRIQAMRLMRELPQVEKQIAAGTLNLSNISQAQSLFNEVKKQNKDAALNKQEKIDVLKQLENKSSRETQRTLLKLRPEGIPLKDRERQVSENQVEVRFIIDDKLKAKLEEIRSLLGCRGIDLNYAELLSSMADLSLAELKAKQFGSRRTRTAAAAAAAAASKAITKPATRLAPSAPDISNVIESHLPTQSRYIPQSIKFEVWKRDGGQCQQCGTKQRLNYDHVIPLAKRGVTAVGNLRLLCFHCNQRAAMQIFGVSFMENQVGH